MRTFFLISLAAAIGSPATPPLTILGVTPDRNPVPKYERLELSVDMESIYSNPNDPDEVDLSCEFISPAGRKWTVRGFYSAQTFRVRFAANETGTWRYTVTAKDPSGTAVSRPDSFSVSPSGRHGWVGIAPNQRYYRNDDGTTWHGMGMGYPWNVKEAVLDSLKAAGANSIVYWNSTFDWEGNGGGKYLIESIDSGLGHYDDRKAERVDQILSWCEARDMKLIFCIWPHPFLGDEINPTNKAGGWEAFYSVNPYKNLVKARDFFDDSAAWGYQKKLYRYMVARWSYSPALEHWWTVVETPGTDAWSIKGPAVVEAWSQRVHDWFKANDPFGHPTSGSQQGNEDNYWANGYRIFDISNREIYYNGSSYTSVALETGKLWTQFQKPIVIGEIGNYQSPKTFHQDLWSALATGAASAPYWWNYPDKWSPENWDHLRAYAAFAQDIALGSMTAPQRLTPAVAGATAYAIQSPETTFGWLLNESGSISAKTLTLQGLPDGAYKLEWFDTNKGVTISASPATVRGGKITLQAPVLNAVDIAFKLRSANAAQSVRRAGGNGDAGSPAPPGSVRLERREGNLWITQSRAFPYRAALLGPDGRTLLTAEASGGGPTLLPLRGIPPGLHFVRVQWDGGSKLEALVL